LLWLGLVAIPEHPKSRVVTAKTTKNVLTNDVLRIFAPL